MLLQNGNGMISLHVGGQNYIETESNFKRDTGAAFPPLPEGIDARVYEPEARHALVARNNVVDGGPMPWPEGDAILANFDAIVAAQKRRTSGFSPTLDMGQTINAMINTV